MKEFIRKMNNASNDPEIIQSGVDQLYIVTISQFNSFFSMIASLPKRNKYKLVETQETVIENLTKDDNEQKFIKQCIAFYEKNCL